MKILIVAVVFSTSLVTGCASVLKGNTQPVSIDTRPHSDVYCRLMNDKGAYTVASTPGSVVVRKSYQDLAVTCEKKGLKSETVNVKSSTGGAVFGNILLGGIVGSVVDCSTGAGYDYPSTIHVPLRKAEK